MSAVTVFAAASDALPPSIQESVVELGVHCATRGIRLVYGGSQRGLMGRLARAARAAGGHVTGVMPRSLLTAEAAAADLSELHVVESLAARKRLMTDLGDVFIALPGGIGTLDEITDVLTLWDAGQHRKPLFLCNLEGFWDPFIALLEGLQSAGVLRPRLARGWRVVDRISTLLEEIEPLLVPAPRVAAAGR